MSGFRHSSVCLTQGRAFLAISAGYYGPRVRQHSSQDSLDGLVSGESKLGNVPFACYMAFEGYPGKTTSSHPTDLTLQVVRICMPRSGFKCLPLAAACWHLSVRGRIAAMRLCCAFLLHLLCHVSHYVVIDAV